MRLLKTLKTHPPFLRKGSVKENQEKGTRLNGINLKVTVESGSSNDLDTLV